MTEIFEKISLYLSFPFVRYALITVVLVSLCASLFGVTLVLKRFSFIGDGLSHVAFGAMAIATILNFTNNLLFVLPITVLCAIFILKSGKNGDVSIAIFSVGALAIGYLLMNIFPSSSNLSGDVCTTLFGSSSILTLSKTDVILSSALAILVIVLFVIFYNRIFTVTFDENFAKASGIKVGIYNLFISVIIAVIIVIAMNLVGSLLISALIIFPALSSMRVFKTFRSVTISSAILSVVLATIGLLVSILFETPVGATIVATNIVAFLIFTIIGKIKK